MAGLWGTGDYTFVLARLGPLHLGCILGRWLLTQVSLYMRLRALLCMDPNLKTIDFYDTHTHACTHARTHAHTHACMHIHTPHMHACMHAHTHMHAHRGAQVVLSTLKLCL